MKIEQASVVLTGASGGLGSEIARNLIHNGARVMLVGRSKEPLLRLATSLCAGSPDRFRVDALVVDITTVDGRAAIIDAARARNVNVLINNAGAPAFGSTAGLLADQATRVIGTNLIAPILLVAGLLPHLKAQPRAQIVNIGSTLGSIGVPGFSTYGASKAGLRSFSESLRRELADTSVKVQYFAPRAIDTPFNSEHVLAFNAKTGSSTDKAAAVARKLLTMIRNEKPERFVGLFEHVAGRLNGLCPRLLDGAFAKHRKALNPPTELASRFPNGE